MAQARSLLLFVRDVAKAARFYNDGLGLPVRAISEFAAELDAGPVTISLSAVDRFVSLERLICVM